MTTQTEALKLALEALQDYLDEYGPWSDDSGAQYVLRVGKEALAQPQQETNKNGSPCPEFWDWLPKAYNFEGDGNFTKYNMEVAFLAGKQASQPEQEPVAWLQIGLAPLHEGDVIARTTKPTKWNPEWWRFEPLYTTPPQRTWVGLTDEEMYRYCPIWLGQADFKALMLHIESKLKDKNTRGQE